jgi:CobQ/CobB/MinD/ParA nucleotide binding domain
LISSPQFLNPGWWWFEVRSEIPQLQVITAIGDSDLEDYVAQLLFSQGWSIIFRALDGTSLMNFLSSRPSELRTLVVITSDLPEFTSVSLPEHVTVINLDGIGLDSHKIMVAVRGQIRAPLIQPMAPAAGLEEERVHRESAITITGTPGSPGRTTLAYLLAQSLSASEKIRLIDADLLAPALSSVKSSQFVIDSIDASQKPRILPEYPERSIIDLGVLPPLDEVVHDRRWRAELVHSIVESTGSLVYVAKSSLVSLERLGKFIDQFPIYLRKIPTTYVINQIGRTREDRALEQRFIELLEGEIYFLIPRDEHLSDNPKSKARKEIDKMAASLR